MTNDYSEFLALKPNSNKIYKYEIINDDEYEGRTYELYSKVKISKDEWDKLLLNLFHCLILSFCLTLLFEFLSFLYSHLIF